MIFLEINGYKLDADHPALIDLARKIANKQIDLSELAKWIEDHSLPG